MVTPWAKFSLPGGKPAWAMGSSPEFRTSIRAIFGTLVERVERWPAGPLAWAMAEVPAAGSLSVFFLDLEKRLTSTGSLWVVLPKKPFAIEQSFPYTWIDVQKAGLAAALVDNKIAALSTRLTSIRFTIPISRRRDREG